VAESAYYADYDKDWAADLLESRSQVAALTLDLAEHRAALDQAREAGWLAGWELLGLAVAAYHVKAEGGRVVWRKLGKRHTRGKGRVRWKRALRAADHFREQAELRRGSSDVLAEQLRARVAELEAQLAGAPTPRQIAEAIVKRFGGHLSIEVRTADLIDCISRTVPREAAQRGEPVAGNGPMRLPCQACGHRVTAHVVDDEERRECDMCACRQYIAPPAPPPEPNGECDRCGKRGLVVPVTVVPIDGPVGRIDLLCLDCAETPEPREVPGPSPADTNDAGTVLQAPEGPGGGETGPACTHGVTFDEAAARGLSVQEVRDHWPRHSGKCERCGYDGLYYASYMHYLSGDW
jgi:hypothetical protein